MQQTIYGFIFKYSLRHQLLLVALTFAAFPFIYLQAELPKRIINDAISQDQAGFPTMVLGFEFEQIPYLFLLCGLFLLLVMANGAFKYFLNVYRGRLGERMLRRLRYMLYTRILRFPLTHFRRVSQGELIPIVTQEVEPLGGFIGDAIAQPLYQAGILLTLLAFILVQDPLLGLAAISLFPVQAIIIPKLQKRVNALGKERVQNVRRLSDHLGESISGIAEIRANDSSTFQRARFSQRLGIIYEIRYEIFRRKFAIKFINNFLAQFTPFMFYSVGGYLAIQNELSVGALIAVISAHKDMNAPWKELLTFYQRREDARIKYDQVIEQFDPPGIMDETLQEGDDSTPFAANAAVTLRGASLADDDGSVYLHPTHIEFALNDYVAITGPSGGGKEEIGPMLARLALPTSGRITIGDEDLAEMPESRIGRHIGYVGPQPYLFSGTVRDNLLLGVRYRPQGGTDTDRIAWVEEALKAGNTVDDPTADWVDYAGLGVEHGGDISEPLRIVLRHVMLADDIYEYGLRARLDDTADEELQHRFLTARQTLHERLAAEDMAGLVEPFDQERFNLNATIAENLLFGTPVGDTFNTEQLASNAYVRQILEEAGLTEDFTTIGQQVAEIMVDLFADFDTNHDLMEQYSFISGETLPAFQAILARVNRTGFNSLTEDERTQLMSLPFRLAPERHRLGLIDSSMQSRILNARHLFRKNLPEDLKEAVAFFDAERLNPKSSIQDNLLFGKISYGRPQAVPQIRDALSQVLRDLDLINAVVEVGLNYEVGVGGTRLSAVQRQKLAIARTLLKNASLLVLNNPFGAFDAALRDSLIERILEAREGQGLVAIMDTLTTPERFARIFTAVDGRVSETTEDFRSAPKAAE